MASQFVSTLATPPETQGRERLDRMPDAQLVEAYVTHRDEAAFGTMVARHGPRVMKVCRQVLGRSPEVDDIFQSTFLLLATRAGSIRNRSSLGHWLHGVAHRMAVRSRARSALRAARERLAAPAPDSLGEDDLDLPQLRLVIHSEVDRLPDRFRRPILLCYVEGRTNEEAARLLGCPSGTLKDRLARGREILRGRLKRRGITSMAILLLLLLPGTASAEAPPPWLVAVTIEAAGRRTGRRRAGLPKWLGTGVARIAAAVLTLTALIASTFAWLLCQPSPPRGTWMRALLDLVHKVCG